MPKYLVIASYTTEGMKGLLAKGGSDRVKATREAAASIGGAVESMYFALGEDDVYVVLDLPDNTSAAALGMAVAATGLLNTRFVALLTPEELDKASAMNVTYRGPTA